MSLLSRLSFSHICLSLGFVEPFLPLVHYIIQFEMLGATEPWMHVLCIVGGAWGANKWVNTKHAMLADVNELRAFKGLPPMVGTSSYFPFVPPVEEKNE